MHVLAIPRRLMLPGYTAFIGLTWLADLQLVLWATVVVIIAWCVVDTAHRRQMCAKCLPMRDISGMQPGRVRSLFARYHRWEGHPLRTVVKMLTFLVGGTLLGLLLPGDAVGWGFLVMAVGVHHSVSCQDFHHQHVVWCPWCQGGDDAQAQVPDPDMPELLPRR